MGAKCILRKRYLDYLRSLHPAFDDMFIIYRGPGEEI